MAGPDTPFRSVPNYRKPMSSGLLFFLPGRTGRVSRDVAQLSSSNPGTPAPFPRRRGGGGLFKVFAASDYPWRAMKKEFDRGRRVREARPIDSVIDRRLVEVFELR